MDSNVKMIVRVDDKVNQKKYEKNFFQLAKEIYMETNKLERFLNKKTVDLFWIEVVKTIIVISNYDQNVILAYLTNFIIHTSDRNGTLRYHVKKKSKEESIKFRHALQSEASQMAIFLIDIYTDKTKLLNLSLDILKKKTISYYQQNFDRDRLYKHVSDAFRKTKHNISKSEKELLITETTNSIIYHQSLSSIYNSEIRVWAQNYISKKQYFTTCSFDVELLVGTQNCISEFEREKYHIMLNEIKQGMTFSDFVKNYSLHTSKTKEKKYFLLKSIVDDRYY